MFLLVVSSYMHWHYIEAPGQILHLGKNFLWFIGHFFSIGVLLRSLFAPWKRMESHRHNGWDFEEIAGNIVSNILSRIIGAFFRAILIVTGLLVSCALVVSMVAVYLFWIAAPFAVVALFLYGVIMLFL